MPSFTRNQILPTFLLTFCLLTPLCKTDKTQAAQEAESAIAAAVDNAIAIAEAAEAASMARLHHLSKSSRTPTFLGNVVVGSTTIHPGKQTSGGVHAMPTTTSAGARSGAGGVAGAVAGVGAVAGAGVGAVVGGAGAAGGAVAAGGAGAAGESGGEGETPENPDNPENRGRASKSTTPVFTPSSTPLHAPSSTPPVAPSSTPLPAPSTTLVSVHSSSTHPDSPSSTGIPPSGTEIADWTLPPVSIDLAAIQRAGQLVLADIKAKNPVTSSSTPPIAIPPSTTIPQSSTTVIAGDSPLLPLVPGVTPGVGCDLLQPDPNSPAYCGLPGQNIGVAPVRDDPPPFSQSGTVEILYRI